MVAVTRRVAGKARPELPLDARNRQRNNGRRRALSRGELVEILGHHATAALMFIHGGRRIPVVTAAERDRYLRDQAIRRHVDTTKATYRDTAEHFRCSLATVMRACKK